MSTYTYTVTLRQNNKSIMKIFDDKKNWVATLPLIMVDKFSPKEPDRKMAPTHKLTLKDQYS